MKLTERLPEIPEAEQTSRVKQRVAIIERLVERVAQLEEQVAERRGEIAVLKATPQDAAEPTGGAAR